MTEDLRMPTATGQWWPYFLDAKSDALMRILCTGTFLEAFYVVCFFSTDQNFPIFFLCQVMIMTPVKSQLAQWVLQQK